MTDLDNRQLAELDKESLIAMIIELREMVAKQARFGYQRHPHTFQADLQHRRTHG